MRPPQRTFTYESRSILKTVFNIKSKISEVYDPLLTQHEEPFKAITKSVTDISLNTIESSLEDFCEIITALPQKLEISMPG
jgi:hypothetical protein